MKVKEALIFMIVCMTVIVFYVAATKDKISPVVGPLNPPKRTSPEVEDPEASVTFEESLASITTENLKEHVYYLASDELQGRQSGEPGCDQARDYLIRQFESYGLPVELDEFSVRTGDKTTENVYAWIEGAEYPYEIIVIGGHYDHIGQTQRGVFNGADDNASGTSAVLEMAQALSMIQDQCKRTIVFQCYSGEELGLIGSKHYCESPKFPKIGPSLRSHIFMENLDMIGYLPQQASITTDYGPVDPFISELQKKYPFAQSVTKPGMSAGASDHAPFAQRGVPSVFMHTGTAGSPYHQTTDDADKLNYEGMEAISKYSLELVWQICENGLSKQAIQSHENEEIEMLDHGIIPFPIPFPE